MTSWGGCGAPDEGPLLAAAFTCRKRRIVPLTGGPPPTQADHERSFTSTLHRSRSVRCGRELCKFEGTGDVHGRLLNMQAAGPTGSGLIAR